MNRENVYKATKLNYTISCLKTLKSMVKDRFFTLKVKRKFSDCYGEFSFYELDDETRSKLEAVLIDFCDRRIAEIEEEFKGL